jgi:P27 family predicted phage terminase small subunit
MPQRAKTTLEHYLQDTKPQGKPAAPSVFIGGRPKCPKHLSPIARAQFRRCVKLLETRRTITPGDADTLAVYSELLARWIVAKGEVGDKLIVTKTVLDSHGEAHEVERLNPLLKIVEKCESQLVRLEASLGLTPTDRDRAKQTKVSDAGEQVIPGSCADQFPELFKMGKLVPIDAQPHTEEEKKNEVVD